MKRLAMLAFVLAACGGSSGGADAGPTFPAQPFMTVASDSGQLSIALRSDPQPPARGTNAFRLTVTDSSGAAVDGVDVAVQPWMPDMGHGSSTNPTVMAMGQGMYDVSGCSMPMAGTWQLRITFSGKLSDHATAQFQVP